MMFRTAFILLLSFAVLPVSRADSVSAEQFKNPPPEFRPLPIRHSEPIRDMPDAMHWLRARHGGGYVLDAGGDKTPSGKDMVNGEAFINPTYLQIPENFQRLEKLIRRLKADGHQAWIYDEYAYPSGSAGGLVLSAHPEHAARVISCRTFRPGETIGLRDGASVFSCTALPWKDGVADLGRARDITEQARKGGFVFEASGPWKVCLFEIRFSDTWKRHNMSRRQLNVLDREAVDCFIQTTHEKYARELGPVLKDVDAFFSDEPQFASAEFWGRTGRKEADPAIQWTDELVPAFEAEKGYPLRSVLPALFLDVGAKTAKYRYDFYDVQSDLMAKNYFGQIQNWCHAHQTRSSGHMLLEESLLFHVMFSGSAFKNWMRQDLPGMDLLGAMPYRSMPFHWEPESVRAREDISCKMVSSVAHLLGKPGAFSETFATAKEATLRDVFGTVAWQYSEGITHLATYTIQKTLSAKEYAKFCDFSGRLALFARRGVPVSRVAVLAPEASVWVSYVPPSGGGFERYFLDNPQATQIDAGFRAACEALLAAQRQFECINAELLTQAEVGDGFLRIGSMEFSVLVLPESRFLAPGVLEKLQAFAASGGSIQFVGALPSQNARAGTSVQVEREVDKLMKHYPKNIRSFPSLSLDWIKRRLPKEIVWEGDPAVRMLVKKDGDQTIVILGNPSKNPVAGKISAPAEGRWRQWNPETGENHDVDGGVIKLGRKTACVLTRPR